MAAAPDTSSAAPAAGIVAAAPPSQRSRAPRRTSATTPRSASSEGGPRHTLTQPLSQPVGTQIAIAALRVGDPGEVAVHVALGADADEEETTVGAVRTHPHRVDQHLIKLIGTIQPHLDALGGHRVGPVDTRSVGASRKPSASRWVRSAHSSRLPPTRRPTATSDATAPRVIATIRPCPARPSGPQQCRAPKAPRSPRWERQTAAAGWAPVCPHHPCQGGTGGYRSVISAAYATTRSTVRFSPRTSSNTDRGPPPVSSSTTAATTTRMFSRKTHRASRSSTTAYRSNRARPSSGAAATATLQ